MPIRFVQAIFMLVCLTVAVAVKWVWPETERIAPSADVVNVANGTHEIAVPTPQPKPAVPVSFQAALYVSPQGNDASGDGSADQPWHSVQYALEHALPGSTIYLAAGNYFEDIATVRSGIPNRPIRIVGPSEAVLQGAGNARVIAINHDYIQLQGFTVDGLWAPQQPDQPSSYRNKLIYAESYTPGDGITGLQVLSMTLRNAGGECLRMKYFATANEVAYSHFENCGQFDFRFAQGGKNGENIYIGTAPEQLNRNPTTDSDQSNGNWIHHNTFISNGNECVDIKEGSSLNIVEYNDCASQKDSASGGFDSRGNGNTFRFNRIVGNRGAGVRLGGDTVADGVANNVYYNELIDNAAGGIKFQRSEQGIVCGNRASAKPASGQFAKQFAPEAPCPHTVPRPVGLLGRNGGMASVESIVKSDEAIANEMPAANDPVEIVSLDQRLIAFLAALRHNLSTQ